MKIIHGRRLEQKCKQGLFMCLYIDFIMENYVAYGDEDSIGWCQKVCCMILNKSSSSCMMSSQAFFYLRSSKFFLWTADSQWDCQVCSFSAREFWSLVGKSTQSLLCALQQAWQPQLATKFTLASSTWWGNLREIMAFNTSSWGSLPAIVMCWVQITNFWISNINEVSAVNTALNLILDQLGFAEVAYCILDLTK